MTGAIEPYGSGHADAAHALWMAALGPTWPLDQQAFARIARHGLIAVDQERLVGLALTDRPAPVATSLVLLVVAPDARRSGLGTTLLRTVVEQLAQGTSRKIQLGGGSSYFWPGVPRDLPGALDFFQSRGWSFTEVSCDLVVDLRGYRTPGEVGERALRAGIALRVANSEDFAAVMAFEEEHFPQWVDFYRSALEADRLVIAVDESGCVVGALILSFPGDGRTLWAPLVGAGTGGIGAVGVSPSVRIQGVGTALVSKACEVLHGGGAERCHAGWTNLLNFYGRLGFWPWREYDMAWQTL